MVRDACLYVGLSRCRGWSVERCRRQCRAASMTTMIVIAVVDIDYVTYPTFSRPWKGYDTAVVASSWSISVDNIRGSRPMGQSNSGIS